MKANDTELLQRLPEVPLPAALDALVFQRACDALDEAAPAPTTPVRVPRAEALVYVAGLSAYLAVLARVALRLLGG